MPKRRTGGVSIVNLFKLLSNQTRLDILMLLRDNCLSLSEISRKLGIDFSTAYRHLEQLINAGIVKINKMPSGERFDFSSVHVFRMLEEAVELAQEIKSEGAKKINAFKSNLPDQFDPDKKLLDMRGQMCPIPEIMTKKELDKLQPGEALLVICDYPLSRERITSLALRSGCTVGVEEIGPISKIYISKLPALVND